MDKICPFLKEECVGSKCMLWTHVLGANPATGQPIDHFDCAITWIPMLLIENSLEERKTGASVQSFRNEMVKSNGTLLTLFSNRPRIENDQA